MARFRPRGVKKIDRPKTARGLVPCLLVLVIGMAVLFFLFYEFLSSGK